MTIERWSIKIFNLWVIIPLALIMIIIFMYCYPEVMRTYIKDLYINSSSINDNKLKIGEYRLIGY